MLRPPRGHPGASSSPPLAADAADCAGTFEVVARFLAVLELYREGNVVLEQAEPLGDLYVTWSPGAPAAAAGAGEEENG